MFGVVGVFDRGIASGSDWNELLSDEAVHWVCGWPAPYRPRTGQGNWDQTAWKIPFNFFLKLCLSMFPFCCPLTKGIQCRKSIWLHGVHFAWGEDQLLWETSIWVSKIWNYVKRIGLGIYFGCRLLKEKSLFYRFLFFPLNLFIYVISSCQNKVALFRQTYNFNMEPELYF